MDFERIRKPLTDVVAIVLIIAYAGLAIGAFLEIKQRGTSNQARRADSQSLPEPAPGP